MLVAGVVLEVSAEFLAVQPVFGFLGFGSTLDVVEIYECRDANVGVLLRQNLDSFNLAKPTGMYTKYSYKFSNSS